MKKYVLVSCMVLFALLGGANRSWALSAAPDMDMVENDFQSITISLVGESVLRVTGAAGQTLSIYNVTGVKVMNIRVDGSDKSYHLNLPQGCYIVKVGNVVKRLPSDNFFLLRGKTTDERTYRNYLSFSLFLLGSCRKHVPNQNTQLTLSYYDCLRQREEHITSFKVREALDSMIRNDNDSMLVDRRVKGYYLRRRPFVWINRKGVDSRADTLLAYSSIGFSEAKFRMPQIRRDLQRMRSLDFDKRNTANWWRPTEI